MYSLVPSLRGFASVGNLDFSLCVLILKLYQLQTQALPPCSHLQHQPTLKTLQQTKIITFFSFFVFVELNYIHKKSIFSCVYIVCWHWFSLFLLFSHIKSNCCDANMLQCANILDKLSVQRPTSSQQGEGWSWMHFCCGQATSSQKLSGLAPDPPGCLSSVLCLNYHKVVKLSFRLFWIILLIYFLLVNGCYLVTL